MKVPLIRDASEVTAIWDTTNGVDPVDYIRELRDDSNGIEYQLANLDQKPEMELLDIGGGLMKCQNCGKEIGRSDGGPTLEGIKIVVELESSTEETITYNNAQLGKYSDGKGESHVGICYECYIDTLFS